MARASRENPADGWHHVMNRGARQQSIFRDDRDRATFLGILHDLHRDDGVEIHAYCLMGNHYHLVVQCPDGNLSEAMQHLGSRYAQRFNKHHEIDGPLFRGRFRSKSITIDHYLVAAVRYVHRNPIELSTTGDLAAYRWSSYPAYVGLAPRPRWLTCSTVAEMAGGGPDAYRSHVETDRPGDDIDDDSVLARLDLARIDEAVADALTRAGDVPVPERIQPRLGRDLALVLAIDSRRASPAELAGHHGLTSRDSVWSAVKRTRKRAAGDPEVRRLLDLCRSAIDGTADGK